MEQRIEVFAAVSFFVIGLSHLFQRTAWIDFFALLHRLGRVGAFAEGFLYLNFGALIVSFHNVWTGPAVVLTLIGWAQILKAVLRFVAPDVVLRTYARMGPERAWQIQVAGGLFVMLSTLLGLLATDALSRFS